MVTLTINGVPVTVESGTTVLAAAHQQGIYIPTLCYDKRLASYGGCGLCMVEAEVGGRNLTVLACLTAAEEGMAVSTQTPQLAEGRRMQLMLLLRSHPPLCPTCDSAGDCRLQRLVHDHQIPELPFSREERKFHVDNDSHLIRFDMNVCIKCGMCVRICNEVQGENELSLIKRGVASEVSTDFDRPLNCDFCGQCVQICPVGAISSKWLVGTGREFELDRTETVCSFCSLGCTLTLRRKQQKVVYATSPLESHNEGNLCVKGRYGWPYVYSIERLRSPLIRKQGALEEVGWDEALRFVAQRFTQIQEKAGSSSLAALGSARLTNEEAYLFNRFVRTVLGTPHIDHGGGYAYRALVDGLAPVLGYPAGTNSIREIRNSEVILLLGADLTESHPVAKNEVIIATGPAKRGRVLVVDSVRTKLCERPGIHLLVSPGTEHLVAFAMLRDIINRGLFNWEQVQTIVQGFDDLVDSLEEYRPAVVARLTGTDPGMIRQAALEYATARTATVILTAGMNRMGNQVALAQAAVDMALITGRIGKAFCGVHVLGEKANSQGAIDMGLVPEFLPGFHSITDEQARHKFEAAWGSVVPKDKGLDAYSILRKAADKQIHGLYVVGENPLETYPDRPLVERALSSLEFPVVQDLFLTSTAQMADAVLPVASFAEKTGTFTSAERRVQCLRPILPRSGRKSDLEIFQTLAGLMGKPFANYDGPEQVMDEIASLVEVYAGISHHRLHENGIQWPCGDTQDPGSEVLYQAGFMGGKARLAPAPPIAKPLSDGLPMRVIPGVLKFHSGSFSQWSKPLMAISPEGWGEMNANDMLAMGMAQGDVARVTSGSGNSFVVKVKESSRAVEGSLIIPQHFGSLKLNSITTWDHPFVKVLAEKV